MARVAAEIKSVRASETNVLVFDCGDLFFKNRCATDLRPKTILSVMKKMGYDAINVAEGELSFGQDFFINQAKETGLTFLSANLTLDKDDTRVIKPYIIRKMKGVTVAITGIIPPTLLPKEAAKEGIRLSGVVESLKAVLAEVKGKKAQYVILLSHLGYDATQDFLTLNDVAGIDLVIVGHGRNFTPTISFVNKTALVQNSFGGEHLGKVTINLKEPSPQKRYQLENIVLTAEYPDDGEIRKIIDDLRQKEGARDEKLRLEKKKQEEEKERGETLKLSPEEFFEKMKKEQAMKAQ